VTGGRPKVVRIENFGFDSIPLGSSYTKVIRRGIRTIRVVQIIVGLSDTEAGDKIQRYYCVLVHVPFSVLRQDISRTNNYVTRKIVRNKTHVYGDERRCLYHDEKAEQRQIRGQILVIK
jgi:hypothetical protein